MTDKQPPFDLPAAHHYFSAFCFNTAWDLIEKPQRTPVEDEQMLLLTFASFYHWTQRTDCTPKNRSIALWQVSRVYALLGQAENALHFAEQCLAKSRAPGVPLNCLGYAFEALARAEMLAGNKPAMQKYLSEAHQIAGKLTDEETRKLLLADLATIK